MNGNTLGGKSGFNQTGSSHATSGTQAAVKETWMSRTTLITEEMGHRRKCSNI